MISLERLCQAPGDVLGALLVDSDADRVRFVRRLVDEWSTGANRFDQPGEALFVARPAGEIVGVCGLNIDPYADPSGEMRVARVRHLYVLSTHRRCGIGERLVTAAMQAARVSFARAIPRLLDCTSGSDSAAVAAIRTARISWSSTVTLETP